MSSKIQRLANKIESHTLESFGHLLAGGAAGSIALAILYPIDQFYARKAVRRSTAHILVPSRMIDDFIHLRKDRIIDIYRGLGFGIFEKFMFNGIYFFFYSLLKNDYQRKYGSDMPITTALIRGSIAGILTQIFTSPLKVVQTIHRTTNQNDTANASISQIISNTNVKDFWSGFGMSMILVINPAINMYCYTYFRKYMNIKFGFKSSLIDFLAGLFSKAIATIICYPLVYIKINQQAEKKSFINVITDTYNDKKILGFYVGIMTKLLQSSLNNALMFAIKEKVVVYTFAMMLYIVNKRKERMGIKTKIANN